MDVEFMLKYLPLYMKAAKLTLFLAFCGIVLSLVIGLLCSFALYYKVKIFQTIAKAYIELSRNTPLLIQLFFLYYGLPKIGIKMEANTCAVLGLSFLGGSYMAEAFRSGLEAVDQIQIESGLSIGLTKFQLMQYVILPQALSLSMPAVGANAIFLLKETSIFSAIALVDLMSIARDLIGLYYKTVESFTMLILFYLIILLPLSLFLTKLERRMRYGQFGN